jgi:hypothetical protein
MSRNSHNISEIVPDQSDAIVVTWYSILTRRTSVAEFMT